MASTSTVKKVETSKVVSPKIDKAVRTFIKNLDKKTIEVDESGIAIIPEKLDNELKRIQTIIDQYIELRKELRDSIVSAVKGNKAKGRYFIGFPVADSVSEGIDTKKLKKNKILWRTVYKLYGKLNKMSGYYKFTVRKSGSK